MKKQVLVLLSAVLVSVIAVGGIAYGALYMFERELGVETEQATHEEERPYVAGYQNPTMLSTLHSLGAKDFSDLELIMSPEACNWSDAAGCYTAGKRQIAVMPGYEDNKTTLAHEYLHYIWDKYDMGDNEVLTSQLVALYGASPSMQSRIDTYYIENGSLQPTEIFSYGCTEMSNEQLGEYIANMCKQHIDTDKLPIVF